MAVPAGYSGATALAMVQANTNEPTLPAASVTLSFLNKGLEEVVRQIGGIRLWRGYPTINSQTLLALDSDVQDVVSANFSMGSTSQSISSSANPSTGIVVSTGFSSPPWAQGALVYPMEPLEQASFMDAAAGFPAVGFGPPQAYMIFQDQGTAPSTLLPAPYPPTLSVTQGASAGTPIEVEISYLNPNGETTPSSVADITPSATEQAVCQSPAGVTNATGYNVYAGNIGGPYFLQNASPIALGYSFVLPSPLAVGAIQPLPVNQATGSGTGGALTMQLYPAAMVGQVNIYYRARPQLWADTTVNSWTNLDTSLQEAAILFATMRVLHNRGRSDEAKGIWQPDYTAMVEDMKQSANRRTIPKSGRVRDVRNRAYPSSPWWM